MRLPLLSFTVDAMDSVAEVDPILQHGFGVVTRTGLHCSPWAHKSIGTFPTGTVRISFSSQTDDTDLDIFSRSLDGLAREFKL